MRFGKPTKPGPKSDLQMRLRHIEAECERIQGPKGGRVPNPAEASAVEQLAYLVGYLAGIVDQHLREGET